MEELEVGSTDSASVYLTAKIPVGYGNVGISAGVTRSINNGESTAEALDRLHTDVEAWFNEKVAEMEADLDE